jgi:hypothetical protein
MSKVNRNEPKRSKASESEYSLMEFAREFPDDAACLEQSYVNEYVWRYNHRYTQGRGMFADLLARATTVIST